MPDRSLPFRQIHLDFHTSPAIPDVGCDFDPSEFAQTLKAARVNSINIFAKCHHGHLYYRTDRPERHPSLPRGLDLLGEQIEALHREGIACPIYISVQCDEYAANTHPEWIAREPDGRPVGAGPMQPGWQIMDMSSPYQDYLAEQVAEILERYSPVDGLWFDMCWDQPSSNRYAQRGMIEAGLNPESAADRTLYACNVARAYMKRFYDMTKAKCPDALVYFNCRPYAYLPDEKQWFEQVEMESLPTGGWGYMYFPKHVRFIRNLGKPYLGMTARFHKSWADFGGLKPYAALEYETAQMVAHGAQCSIGDQLHPRGTLDKAAYELIGRVYERIEAREPWLEGAKAVTQVAVIQNAVTPVVKVDTAEAGVTRMLTQLKHQFDFVQPSGDWKRYELVILPDNIAVDQDFALELESYVARGGKLLATGHSGLDVDGVACSLPCLGIEPEGNSPFTATYVRFGEAVGAGVPATDHVMYDCGVRVRSGSAEALAHVVEPYFERTWQHFSSHQQTPAATLTDYAAATRCGNAACIAYPIFSAYASHGNLWMRQLVGNILTLLLPEPLLKVDAPSSAETSIMRQPGRTIVHLLQYCPERRADGIDIVEDIVPLRDVPLSLRLPRAPSRAYLAPEQTPLAVIYSGNRASVTVPEVRGHAMVVIEE